MRSSSDFPRKMLSICIQCYQAYSLLYFLPQNLSQFNTQNPTYKTIILFSVPEYLTKNISPMRHKCMLILYTDPQCLGKHFTPNRCSIFVSE